MLIETKYFKKNTQDRIFNNYSQINKRKAKRIFLSKKKCYLTKTIKTIANLHPYSFSDFEDDSSSYSSSDTRSPCRRISATPTKSNSPKKTLTVTQII
jgi:hypothetical protein